MNLLAHFYLAGNSPQLRVGNFIGDGVKGSDYSHFPEEIALGIKMHREIDSYSDNHEVTINAKKLISRYRHYSSVIIDIYYDHFLAKNWNKFDERPLPEFAKVVYQDLSGYKEHFPRKCKKMYKYMIKYNWLELYASLDGIERVLHGLSRRTIFKSKMEQSIKELKLHYEEFDQAFLEFFPYIIDHTKNYRI